MSKQIKLPLVLSMNMVPIPGFEFSINIGRSESIAAVEDSIKNYGGNIIVAIQEKSDIKDVDSSNLKGMGIFSHIENFEFIKSSNEKKIYKMTILPVKVVKILEPNLVGGRLYSKYNPVVYKKTSLDFIKKTLEDIKSKLESPKFSELKVSFSYEEIKPFLKSTPEKIVNALMYFLPLSHIRKYDLLNEISIDKKITLINTSLNELMVSNFKDKKNIEIDSKKINDDISESVSKQVKDKFTKQQKEFYLREQLKTIQEELNKITGEESEIITLKNKVNNNPYPKIIKEKALKEIKKLENSQFASAEANVIRNYLEWLLDIPYWQLKEEINSISNVIEVLDKNHYGLEKVKERIIEYLAVKISNPDSKAPILCFVGPPGTGKTSFAKSIAFAIGRKYIKISLGGVKDEAEIRGHRRTYIGSMPGKIISAMKKSKVINPLILLDEVDKLSSDYKGDPTSALLEAMDYEQNKNFQDHYIEEDYDLSKVMFVATANYLQNVPEPLIDRLEIIELSSYTEIEKINIANSHLIKKVLDETKLKKLEFKISNSSLSTLIRHYTMEAGVRELYRVLETLARKIVVKKIKDKRFRVKTLTKETIVEYLGPQKYDYSRIDKNPQIGAVQGLAWTQYGGDILPIEIILYDGKGDITITGQLKDVMKESASIAFSFVKANYKKFGIDPIIKKVENGKEVEKNLFKDFDIHVHSPDGATPKDGPSAGVTFTTALISAFSKKSVSQYLGMTGEITLRGNVLQIGGLKEKSISAHRSGLKKILIPKENMKDLIHIPKEVKKSLEIIPVASYFDVYKIAFS